MNKSTVPLKTDAAVAHLQDALQEILERGVILRDDEGAREELSAALKREHSEQMYGEATRKLVSIFQEERRLEVSGEVDEATANAINVLLREWGLLEQPDAHRPFVVSGQVRREDGLPVHGVIMRAFHESDRGGISLGEDTADAEGRYTIRCELLRETASINLRVSVTDEDGRLLHSSDVIRGAKPLEVVDLTLPMARKPVTQDWGEEETKAKNANKTFCITGRVIDSTTQQGVAGLRVGAWDKEMICDDLVSSTVTDQQGAFQMEFTDSYFKELCQDRQPDLFFKVFRDNELIKSTKDSVFWNVATGNTEVVIEVDLPAAGKPEDTFVVRGKVRDADGSLLAGVVVKAFDKDLRRKQWLGEETTNKTGEYEIRYSDQQFCRAEKGNADLVVKAVAADGSLLAASPVLFNAPPSATVDLTIPAEVLLPPTLFEKIGLALGPLLEGLKVEELEEDEEDKEHQDLSFLSGETGFDKPTLARFVLAHKLAQERIRADFTTGRLAQQGIRAEFWFVLLGGSFYQFTEDQSLKEQLATVLDTLPSLDAAAVRKALTRGFNQKEIPEAFREDVAGWIEAFLKLIASRLVSGPGEPTFVKLALEHANITGAKKQETFARLFNEHKALTPELLGALENDPSFKKEEIADLRTSFRLAELTRGDFSIVKMIKEQFGVRQPDEIRSLARKSESEWVNLVKEKHAAGDIKLPIEVGEIAGQIEIPTAEVYGKTLERQFREAFPTTAFAGGLARALQNGGAHGLPHAEALGRFLERHEDFELLNTPVDDFLKNNGDPDFRALADDEGFRLEVKAVQRVFKLAPTFEATDALLANDVHSAQQVYRLGESEFVRRYADSPGFTVETARLAWNRAADTHAAVLTVVADLKALEADALPLALHNGNEAVATFPNWNNLFKTGGLCECEHCRSVLGPAAYFADLLMFLKDRKSRKPIPIFGTLDYYSVKDILFDRRPDLGFLELNCDNALTPLPYIDVVCEVLENAIDATHENDLELTVTPGASAEDLETAVKKVFKEALIDPLNDGKEKIELGDNLSLSEVNPDQLVVHSDNVTYLLKRKETLSFFAEILRNTKASAAELRAYPQYVNPKAYEKLRAAKYPLSLPFDLFAEEVRAAFQKTNLQRWDLMRTLRSTAAPNNPTDGEIAAEYLGISTDATAAFDEKRLILMADATIAGQQTLWGEAEAGWLNTVGNAKTFLQKTSLEYNELLALLELKFINPTGDIGVHHLDPSCDTDQKVIQVLDESKLDRIHRFLRLWRKLKDWKMWELDLVIGNPAHPGIGNGALDEPFLVNLFYFCQLRKRLGGKTTVEQVCALFGNLNTETRFTKLHEKREDALYQSLFLNKRLINPLDPTFAIDPATNEIRPFIDPVTGLPKRHKLVDHHPVTLAALGIREGDLVLLEKLTKASDGITPYITDDLTLGNLSFLWRHAWLSKLLKLKTEEWKTILKVFQQDILHFATPEAAWKFVERIDHLKAAGFTPDELNWLLAADRSAKAATKETDAARFLATLRKDLQAIQGEFDPGQYDFLTVTPPTDVDGLTALLTSLLQKLNRDEAATQFFIATLRNEVAQETIVAGLPAGFDFPVAIKNTIRIRYDDPATTLRFTGLMTAAERTTLLTVTGIAAYQEAIEGFFISPRLALKFFAPVFTAPLANLPTAVDFKSLPDAALALKMSYDAEQHLLRFEGILSKDEKSALDALSADVAYRNAVNSLLTQPVIGVFPPEKIWLLDADLQFPLRDLNVPANDHLADNLTTAVTKALAYLSKTLSENATIQQSSTQLGLTEPLTRHLLSHYALLPDTLLKYLTGTFAATGGVVEYDPLNVVLKNTFDGWFWANKAATILNKWKITLAELEKITALTAGAQLLDLLSLPLDATHAIASIDRFIRTSRLLRMRDSLSETDITLLEVLEKLERERLTVGTYLTNAFAADMQRLNEFWPATDVEALTASLDLAYPADYLLAESWERLRRAFYFLDNLNAGAVTVTDFAAAAMSDVHAKTIKELLRSKFGAETWLALAVEIQDVLRERKRDALAAFLLTQPPADAPSGKWENTNDLYAYYLLDVEMSSCQLTSRLVQGSGSIQLFVQRCFMGLEPNVVVQADGATGDSAWRWWKWMRKYRVWEANRKVFLWPENWIEPELKKDKSPFFKDMENELLQNEINQYTAETAFSNYLEKLDGVAQLEIAGLYQEDDGDNAIVHVFGRTAGAEPHLYYYRRYDYRQWTPWEKVELDIQGDYLIPAVVNKRLFLFWPVFTEVPDETGNSRVTVPNPGDIGFTPDKTKKRLRLQMAVSDYRQGKWTPKKVSTDFHESGAYDVEIVRRHYRFLAIDRREVGESFSIRYSGDSVWSAAAAQKTIADLDAAVTAANEKVNTAGQKKSDAATTLNHAQDAVGLVDTAAAFAKILIPVADRIVATSKDAIKNLGDVFNTVVVPSAASHASFTYSMADAAKGAVQAAAGLTAIATDRATKFFNAIGQLDQDFRAVEARVRDLITIHGTASLNKHNLPDLAEVAQRAAANASSAGTVAKNAIEFFRDEAITAAGTAEKKLDEAIALATAAAEARRNFKHDDNKRAHLSGAFEISGCTGAPEKADPLGSFTLALQPEDASNDTEFSKWVELPSHDDSPENDFTLVVSYVFSHRYPRLVLRKSPGIFKMSPSWHLSYFDMFNGTLGTFLPFFYNDKQHTFFVLPSIQPGFGGAAGKVRDYYPDIKKAAREYPQSDMKDFVNFLNIAQKFHFQNFYHPFVCHFAKLVYNPLKGIPALMSRETQLNPGERDDEVGIIVAQHTVFNFEQDYDPDKYAVVKLPPQYPLLPDCYPREVVDFTPDGAYSPYNWELFFHAPLLIANSLSKNQRFEEAREWYHFIFNPIGVESPIPGGLPMSKYWITKPFFETTDPQYVQQRIDNIMRMLAGDTSLPGFSTQAKKDLEDQVFDWRTNPFEPHRIANYRTVAYQKTVVMKYLDNLIAWGDNLFGQDSMESINEATQLYVVAAEILGPRPKRIPHQAKPPVESFNELEKQFDDFSNALVQVENFVPVPLVSTHVPDRTPLPMLYFCIPQNDKMLGYWDTVADRLYKIRHCMNIEGVVRQLALFEPPIDPAALVKAVAAGVDISAALADLNAPLPLYRFSVLLQKANEVCNDVKALGGALLAALEKKDAEAMGLLRQSQEIRVLEAVKAVKEKQIDEARENLEGTQKSKVITETRRDYYRDIEKIVLGEQLSLDKQETAFGHQGKAQQYNITASALGYIPNITIGVSGAGGSPHVNAQLGTGNIISALQAAAGVQTLLSNAASFEAGRASTLAGYDRRFEDWKLQERLADKELDQIAKQIAAAELRIAIAEKELDNHVLQIENAKATDAFMRSKYTNEELYQWQVGQISGVYFQSYKLAYDLAKGAERCFRFELGLQDSSYINFGYWDSLKKGLLSGEKLQYDLRRLETAYQEQNRREYELTKHLSLALLDPLALVKLRETGRCFLRLPEENFDLDYPGHYFRRIKSVSITLPCVTGPYTSVSCTLRLLKNYIRINTTLTDDYAHAQDEGGVWTEDPRFVESNIPVKAIAASNAQNDSGVFELSFRDERYLPFEGAGAVSHWQLELFNDQEFKDPVTNEPDFGKPLRQFDYGTITDAVIHVKYTAKEDAGPFKNAAIKHLREYFERDGTVPSLRLFNLRQEFPTQWHRFLNPANPGNGKNIFELEMSPSVFRMLDEEKTLKVNTIWLLARCTDTGNYSVVMTPPLPAPPPAGSNSMTLARVNQYGGLHFSQKDVAALEIKVVPTDPPVKWQLQMARPGGGNLQEDPVKKVMEVEDLLLVLCYEWD